MSTTHASGNKSSSSSSSSSSIRSGSDNKSRKNLLENNKNGNKKVQECAFWYPERFPLVSQPTTSTTTTAATNNQKESNELLFTIEPTKLSKKLQDEDKKPGAKQYYYEYMPPTAAASATSKRRYNLITLMKIKSCEKFAYGLEHYDYRLDRFENYQETEIESIGCLLCNEDEPEYRHGKFIKIDWSNATHRETFLQMMDECNLHFTWDSTIFFGLLRSCHPSPLLKTSTILSTATTITTSLTASSSSASSSSASSASASVSASASATDHEEKIDSNGDVLSRLGKDIFNQYDSLVTTSRLLPEDEEFFTYLLQHQNIDARVKKSVDNDVPVDPEQEAMERCRNAHIDNQTRDTLQESKDYMQSPLFLGKKTLEKGYLTSQRMIYWNYKTMSFFGVKAMNHQWVKLHPFDFFKLQSQHWNAPVTATTPPTTFCWARFGMFKKNTLSLPTPTRATTSDGKAAKSFSSFASSSSTSTTTKTTKIAAEGTKKDEENKNRGLEIKLRTFTDVLGTLLSGTDSIVVVSWPTSSQNSEKNNFEKEKEKLKQECKCLDSRRLNPDFLAFRHKKIGIYLDHWHRPNSSSSFSSSSSSSSNFYSSLRPTTTGTTTTAKLENMIELSDLIG